MGTARTALYLTVESEVKEKVKETEGDGVMRKKRESARELRYRGKRERR